MLLLSMTFVERICEMVTQFFGSPTARTGSGAFLLESAKVAPPDSKTMAGMINSILRILLLQCYDSALAASALTLADLILGAGVLGLKRQRSATGQRQHSGVRALQI